MYSGYQLENCENCKDVGYYVAHVIIVQDNNRHKTPMGFLGWDNNFLFE
jgi:hypothetical protein